MGDAVNVRRALAAADFRAKIETDRMRLRRAKRAVDVGGGRGVPEFERALRDAPTEWERESLICHALGEPDPPLPAPPAYIGGVAFVTEDAPYGGWAPLLRREQFAIDAASWLCLIGGTIADTGTIAIDRVVARARRAGRA